MINQNPRIVDGKVVYRLTQFGEKIVVTTNDQLGDIVVEETETTIVTTTRGILLQLNHRMNDGWDKQHEIGKKYKRFYRKHGGKIITPIFDAQDPDCKVTENGQYNYMNPDEAVMMSGSSLLNIDELRMEFSIFSKCHLECDKF